MKYQIVKTMTPKTWDLVIDGLPRVNVLVIPGMFHSKEEGKEWVELHDCADMVEWMEPSKDGRSFIRTMHDEYWNKG